MKIRVTGGSTEDRNTFSYYIYSVLIEINEETTLHEINSDGEEREIDKQSTVLSHYLAQFIQPGYFNHRQSTPIKIINDGRPSQTSEKTNTNTNLNVSNEYPLVHLTNIISHLRQRIVSAETRITKCEEVAHPPINTIEIVSMFDKPLIELKLKVERLENYVALISGQIPPDPNSQLQRQVNSLTNEITTLRNLQNMCINEVATLDKTIHDLRNERDTLKQQNSVLTAEFKEQTAAFAKLTGQLGEVVAEKASSMGEILGQPLVAAINKAVSASTKIEGVTGDQR